MGIAPRMYTYHITNVYLVDGEIRHVAMAHTDVTLPGPDRHVTATLDDLVALLDAGEQLAAVWGDLPTADGENNAFGTIPVELVTLANGRRSVEVAQRGQPEGYRSLKDLPESGPTSPAPGYWLPIQSKA